MSSAQRHKYIHGFNEVVGDRAKHGAGRIGSVAGARQIFLDQALREHLDRYKPDLAAFALDPENGENPRLVQVEKCRVILISECRSSSCYRVEIPMIASPVPGAHRRRSDTSFLTTGHAEGCSRRRAT